MTTFSRMIHGKLRFMSQLAFVVCSLLFAGYSCIKSETDKVKSDWIARVDSHYLYLDDINKAMPSGLDEEDSLKFVNSYINNWIESNLMAQVATDEIDIDQVEKLVEEYRRQLILSMYRRAMFESHAVNVPEDSIINYYESHIDEWKLQGPMVKGTYLKLPDNAPNLKIIKRLYKSQKQEDIDRLEKEVLSSAIHYDYFRDRWIDWEQIETKIPYEFDENPEKWIKAGNSLDFTEGGFTYLLYISDYLSTGSTSPLEGVRDLVVDRLLKRDRQVYDARLIQQLREKALDSGRMEINPDY